MPTFPLAAQMLDYLIQLAQELRCNFFAYEYSGYGSSTGTATEANVLKDATAAYQVSQRNGSGAVRAQASPISAWVFSPALECWSKSCVLLSCSAVFYSRAACGAPFPVPVQV